MKAVLGEKSIAINVYLKEKKSWMLVAHTFGPSYSGGRD
jgi:hypothetical protein